MLGGMTSTNFHSPAQESLNLRSNILEFGAGDVNPTPAPAGIVLFGLGFAGMGLLRKFRKGKTAVV